MRYQDWIVFGEMLAVLFALHFVMYLVIRWFGDERGGRRTCLWACGFWTLLIAAGIWDFDRQMKKHYGVYLEPAPANAVINDPCPECNRYYSDAGYCHPEARLDETRAKPLFEGSESEYKGRIQLPAPAFDYVRQHNLQREFAVLPDPPRDAIEKAKNPKPPKGSYLDPCPECHRRARDVGYCHASARQDRARGRKVGADWLMPFPGSRDDSDE